MVLLTWCATVASHPRWILGPLVRGVWGLIFSSRTDVAPVVDFDTRRAPPLPSVAAASGCCCIESVVAAREPWARSPPARSPTPRALPNQGEQHGRGEEEHSTAAGRCRTKARSTGVMRRNTVLLAFCELPRSYLLLRVFHRRWVGPWLAWFW